MEKQNTVDQREAYQERELLHDIITIFTSTKLLREIYPKLLTLLANRFAFPSALIFRYERKRDELVAVSDPYTSGKCIKLPQRISSSDLFNGETEQQAMFFSGGKQKYPFFSNNLIRNSGIESALFIPMFVNSAFYGAIALFDVQDRPDIQPMVEQIQIIANRLGVEIARKENEEALRRYANILEVTTYVGELLLKRPHWEEGIFDLLERLGNSTESVRVFIFQNIRTIDEVLRMKLHYDWATQGLFTLMSRNELRGLPYEESLLHPYTATLENGEAIYEYVDFIPEDDTDDDITSTLIVPIFSGAEWWGFIGFKFPHLEHRLRQTEINILRSLAGILGAAIHREGSAAALLKSEERLNLAVEGAGLGLWDWNLSLRSLHFNATAVNILGHAPHDAGTHPLEQWENMMLPEDRAETMTQLNAMIEGLTPFFRAEYRVVTKHEHERWIQANGKVVERDTDGTPLRAIGIFQDITQQKQAEKEAELRRQQLMHADKLVSLGTLVAGVAHEINNPNSFIMLNAPILKDIWDETLPTLKEWCNEHGTSSIGRFKMDRVEARVPMLVSGILDGSQRIKVIVENLKNFARQDVSDMTQNVDINEMVKACITLITNKIKHSTRNFSSTCKPGLPPVRGNFQRLEQVIINLMINACDALPDNERALTINTNLDKKNKQVIIQIIDEGEGMSPDTIKHIIDPFFTTKRDSGGTGLGLSISTGIIDEHNGTLTFESAVGRGTTATVRLPYED